MNHVDTFSGIGAWSLAAKWMGWNTLAFCEKEPFCQQVLKKQFPRIPIHDDIFTFSGKPFRDRVDILTGSTPCQPFSQAGQRKGSNDERHLFPEFLRVVAECRPRWVVIENVYGLLNIESGRVFEAYNTSLESEGYSVQTICVPASALNAPHRRDRLWIVAKNTDLNGGSIGTANEFVGIGVERNTRTGDAVGLHRESNARNAESNASDSLRQVSQGANALTRGSDVTATDTDNAGIRASTGDTNAKRRLFGGEPSEQSRSESSGYCGDVADAGCEYGQSGRDDRMDANSSEWPHSKPDIERCGDTSENEAFTHTQDQDGRWCCGAAPQHPELRGSDWGRNWRDVAASTCVRGMDDGISVELDGFKLTASKHREARLKALGNAIVPQIAYHIFRAIQEVEK